MAKRSKQKEAILKVLIGTVDHPTADWVFTEVKKELPNISLGTVYRNLKLLCEQGKIVQLDLCGSLSRFDAFTSEHYHFRCEACGKIYDVNVPVDNVINARVETKTGFKVKSHRLEFRGTCRNCLQNNKKPRKYS